MWFGRLMSEDTRSVVVAFDGSNESETALRAAAGLFRDRLLLVVSVWEPGLAMAMMSSPDSTGMSFPPPTPEQIVAVDRAQHDHATSAAESGVQIVRELGGTAEALPVPEDMDIAEAVIGIADDRDAAAIVVGSRGLGAVKSRLMGSVSRRVLHDTRRPVLIVRAPD
jgi:nucleotide-binding universal stress UspA family protein